jgi:hypothetical protein
MTHSPETRLIVLLSAQTQVLLTSVNPNEQTAQTSEAEHEEHRLILQLMQELLRIVCLSGQAQALLLSWNPEEQLMHLSADEQDEQ